MLSVSPSLTLSNTIPLSAHKARRAEERADRERAAQRKC